MPPAVVSGNNWRQIPNPPTTMQERVSVVVPYYQNLKKLKPVLAALQRQEYPRALTEIIVVDDGSDPPLTSMDVPEEVRVITQERNGFGAARARNNGARAATGSILVFVDSDMVLPPDNVAAHAAWHHRASNLYTTLCDLRYVDGDMVNVNDLEQVPYEPMRYLSGFMKRTEEMTNGDDDIFGMLPGPNFALRRDQYFYLDGQDERFRYWGLEDTHLTYRAYARGLVLVPIMDTYGLHLGTPTNRGYRASAALAEQSIPHRTFRKSGQNRVFLVPEYVVSIESGDPAVLLMLALDILNHPPYDLMLRVNLEGITGDNDLAYIRHRLEHDPRVMINPQAVSTKDFPDSPFHVTIRTDRPLRRDIIPRLRRGLGGHAVASCYGHGLVVEIARSWFAHRRIHSCDAEDEKVLNASELEGKLRPIHSPIEAPPHRWPRRLLENAQRIHNTEGRHQLIKWFVKRVKYRIPGMA